MLIQTSGAGIAQESGKKPVCLEASRFLGCSRTGQLQAKSKIQVGEPSQAFEGLQVTCVEP